MDRVVRTLAHGLPGCALSTRRLWSHGVNAGPHLIGCRAAALRWREAVDAFADNFRLDRQPEISTESVWVDGDAARLQQVGIAANASVAPERCSRSRRVLVIEDSADARETLRRALERAGHEVYDAADGLRGLELWMLIGRTAADATRCR